ncbi:hypothetical protein PoMZ_04580 [Pyricularia oryzae]|uniref:Uncharacterized protein n=1 Tax=Pyricularia oryzae TaxID=318829 RepID=A0A4P7NA06_PYROR|nr:hypothetical protein MCOR05_010481 [Pyricularia oryzae]QBZ59617.1 hypothetical protein PoMZ_04580 [Pyricularia oryzae]
MDQPHTASAFGVLCAATPSGCSSAPDLAAPGGGGMELSDAAAVHEGPEDDVSALTHDGRDAPWGRAVWTDRREIGGGAARKHAMTGFAAADATPVRADAWGPPERTALAGCRSLYGKNDNCEPRRAVARSTVETGPRLGL